MQVRFSALGMALGVVTLAWCAVIVLWRDAVLFLCFDDAFYYFEIARNLGTGYGSTFDRLQPTNGYHPLWLLACVPIFAGGAGGLGVVRAVLVGQTLVWGAALWLLARGVEAQMRDAAPAGATPRPRLLPALLSVAVVGGPWVFKAVVNGMESTLYAACYLPLLLLSWSARGRLLELPRSRRWLFGLVAALAFLARTDAVLLWLAVGIWCLPALRRQGRAGLGRALELFGLPALAFAGYLASNLLWFGAPFQVTASLKRVSPDAGQLAWIAACLALPFALGRLVTRPAAAERYPATTRALAATGWFGGFVALLFAYYYGMQRFARPWYFGPAALYVALLAPLALHDWMRRAATGGRTGAITARGALVVSLAALAVALQLRGAATSSIVEVNRRVVDATAWLDATLPPDARIGVWDAGLWGYLAERRIVNLDGVASSHEYLGLIERGAQGEWVRRAQIGWLANHGTARDGHCAEVVDWVGKRLPGAGAELVARWPAEPGRAVAVPEDVCVYRLDITGTGPQIGRTPP